MRNTTNKSLTNTAARPASPKNPRYAAITARTRKVAAQPNMEFPASSRAKTCVGSLSSTLPTDSMLAVLDGLRGAEDAGEDDGEKRLLLGEFCEQRQRRGFRVGWGYLDLGRMKFRPSRMGVDIDDGRPAKRPDHQNDGRDGCGKRHPGIGNQR